MAPSGIVPDRTSYTAALCVFAVTLTLIMAVVTIAPYLVSLVEWPRPEYIAALLSSMVMVASLPMRREHPLLMMTLVAIGAAIQFFFVPFPVLSIFVVPIASYSVARWVDGHQSRCDIHVGPGYRQYLPQKEVFQIDRYTLCRGQHRKTQCEQARE